MGPAHRNDGGLRGIYATLKAREMNPYIRSTGTYMETVQPDGEASAVVADNVVTVND